MSPSAAAAETPSPCSGWSVTRREGWTNPPSRCTHRTRSGGCGTRRGAAAAAAEQERLRRPRLPRMSEDEKRVAVVVKRVFLAVAGVAPAAAAAMGGEQDGCGASERMQDKRSLGRAGLLRAAT